MYGQAENFEYQTNDFQALLRYVNHLASNKLGYPVSLLTYLGVVNNQSLGIQPGSLANVLLNNVGDPFKDSETSLLEVKKHEREVISILEKYYGAMPGTTRGYVTTGGTEGNFAGLWWSKRYLINKALDDLISMDNEIKLQNKKEKELTAGLTKISLNDPAARMQTLQEMLDIKNAIADKKNIVQQLLTPTVFFSKNHTHYSIPKIAEILRLNIRPVLPCDDGSMDIANFKKEILLHVKAHPHSAVIVIANIGTTITGAIDDVPAIKKVLDESKPKPVYTIHLDGALTGFVLPILQPFGKNIQNYFDDLGVNTLAVSAHKYPGLSQPCGIVLAKRNFFEKAFEKTERSIEYVGNILDVTITGSRSGLNVLMFYNALRALGLDRDNEKLKKMVEDNIENARYLCEKLRMLYGNDKVYYPFHFNVIFPRPSTEVAKKYQLMLTGDKATICVLSNVNKDLIDQFVKDLQIDKEKAMNKTMTELEYTIDTLSGEHIKRVVDLFVKTFCDSEPVTKRLGIRYRDYEPFATEVVKKASKEGMSKVIQDKQGRILAFAIAEDLADPFIPHLAHYPKLKPVFELLDQLSHPFTEGHKFLKGKIAHIWIACVDPAYRGLGLSTAIDMACVEAAAKKGYDFAYAEFTSELSENVTHQFKILKLYNKINYDDFELADHEAPFKGLQGAAASYLAAIRPGVKLDSLPNCYSK